MPVAARGSTTHKISGVSPGVSPRAIPGTGSPTIKFLVEEESSNDPVLLKCNRSAVLSVYVFGSPKPSVRWFVGQRLVREGPKYGLTTDGKELHALMIRQVTEELQGGVIVTASNENGINSRLIDVKTYRVLSRLSSSDSPDGTTGTTSIEKSRSFGTLRPKQQRQTTSGRHSTGSFHGHGAYSISSSSGPKTRRTFNSSDAVLSEENFAGSGGWSEQNSKVQSTGRVTTIAGKVVGRRKAFSWVENLVEELPTPPIKAGIWEWNTVSYTDTRECHTASQAPVKVRTLPPRYAETTRNKGTTEIEDPENELLWELYGFKLGREPVPLEKGNGEPTRRQIHTKDAECNPKRNHRKAEPSLSGREDGFKPMKEPMVVTNTSQNVGTQRGFGRHTNRDIYKLPVICGPSGGMVRTIERAKSASGLERISARPDPKYLYINTNVRTVRCENPLFKQPGANELNDSSLPLTVDQNQKRFSPLPESNFQQQHVGSETGDIKRNMFMSAGNLPDSFPRQEDVENQLYSIPHRRPETVKRRVMSAKNPKYFSLGHVIQNPEGFDQTAEERRSLARSCENFNTGKKPQRSLSHPEGDQGGRSDARRRVAYSATVSLRRKDAELTGSNASDRITKFILVDIDLEARDSTMKINNGERNLAPGADWTSVRGRTQVRSELLKHEDKRSQPRCRSADNSMAHHFQQYWFDEQLKSSQGQGQCLTGRTRRPLDRDQF